MCGRTSRRRKLKKLSNSVTYFDDLYILFKWMGSKDYKSVKKLKPRVFNGTGRGLMTVENISPGDVIISIPENLLVTPNFVLNSYLGTFFKKFYPKASGHEILSIFLMCEKAKGKLSEWHPYISSLPLMYDISIYFSEHAFKMLPKSLSKSCEQQYESFKKSFSSLSFLIHKLASFHPIFKDEMKYENFKWAWSAVNTRCIYMECMEKCDKKQCTYHLALAPFLDLLNHSNDVQVQAGFNKNRNHYEIITFNKIKKYSQVFINYGPHDNYKLFIEYGFVIPENCYDSILFSCDDIISAYKKCKFPSHTFSQKLKFIMDNNLVRHASCNQDDLSWHLNIILQILVSEDGLKYWTSLLHKDNSESLLEPKFTKLKNMLINLKINELKLTITPCANCPDECSSQQILISRLHSIENSILINALS